MAQDAVDYVRIVDPAMTRDVRMSFLRVRRVLRRSRKLCREWRGSLGPAACYLEELKNMVYLTQDVRRRRSGKSRTVICSLLWGLGEGPLLCSGGQFQASKTTYSDISTISYIHHAIQEARMPPYLPSLHIRMLPPEIICYVIREAWSTIIRRDQWNLRWNFYKTISMVSRLFHAAVQDAVLRVVAIRTPHDFKIYRCLVKLRWGVDPKYEGVDEHVHPDARGYFEGSELYIILADWVFPGTGFQYRTDYARIPRYIPACKYLHVLLKELPSNDQSMVPYYQPLFECLSQYSQYNATRHMSFQWNYTHNNRYILPETAVRGVTHLRLRDYPRCVCHSNHPPPPGRKRHYDNCLSFHLLNLFPDLRHLHMDTPYFLKNLATPSNLMLVTIEVPPDHYSASHGQFSSLSAWNIVSALSLGFLSGRIDPEGGHIPPSSRRKIIVNTGPQEPQGWSVALAACKAHNIDLELRHVYKNPTLRK